MYCEICYLTDNKLPYAVIAALSITLAVMVKPNYMFINQRKMLVSVYHVRICFAKLLTLFTMIQRVQKEEFLSDREYQLDSCHFHLLIWQVEVYMHYLHASCRRNQQQEGED